MKLLTAVIPVRDHWRFTVKCLALLFKYGLPEDQMDVIVIDNASIDFTKTLLSHLQSQGKPIKVIQNETNKNFLLGTNQGWREVETPYALLLSNDVEVKEGCIQSMLDVFSINPQIGISSGVGYYPDKDLPPLWWFYRGDEDIGNLYRTEIEDMDAEFIETDVAPVACAIVKRKVWEKIGFFDERFVPAMYEQEDYSLMAKEAGFKVVIVPKARFIHHLGTTTFSNQAYYNGIIFNNRKIFVEKWGEKLRRRLV